MTNKHTGMNDFTKDGMRVFVKDGQIENAIKKLKRRMTQEGLIKEMRAKVYYEPPSVRKVREKAQARKRWLKKLRARNADL